MVGYGKDTPPQAQDPFGSVLYPAHFGHSSVYHLLLPRYYTFFSSYELGLVPNTVLSCLSQPCTHLQVPASPSSTTGYGKPVQVQGPLLYAPGTL